MWVFRVQLGSGSGGGHRALLLVRELGRGSDPSRGASRVSLPNFADNMGGALNAESEASTEVEVDERLE